MGWMVNATPRPPYLRERYAVPTVRVARLAPGPLWADEVNLAPNGIQSPDSPTRSESLYRLTYPETFKYPIRTYWKQVHVPLKSPSFWDVTPYTLTERHESFKKACCQGLQRETGTNMEETNRGPVANLSYWLAHNPDFNSRAAQRRASVLTL
jgi:hypothetical protein